MSSIFDPGKKDRQRAARLAEEGRITGGGAVGAGGIRAGFDFSNGRSSINTSLGTFAPLLERLQGLAGTAFTQGAEGLPSELTELGGQTIDRLGQIDVNRLQNQSDFDALGNVFGQALGVAGRDPFDMGSEISSRLRALSERRNSRLVNKTFDRLKRSGKLGTTGGAGIAAELDQNLFDEGLKFDLAGLDFGQRVIQDAFGRALGASQQREAIGARQFGEEFSLENLGGQRALSQFGVGDQLFRNLMASQLQGANLGMQFLGGATNLSQLPLMFLQAAQNSASLGSNSNFAAAGVNQQNAAMAKSPFLEALNAAGSFMTGIAPGGIIGKPTAPPGG